MRSRVELQNLAPARVLGSSIVVRSKGKVASGKMRFDSSATYRGETSLFKVYYDNALGTGAGSSIADIVLSRCDTDYQLLSDIFGSVSPPLPFTVVVASDSLAGSGAYHHSPIDKVLYCAGNVSADPGFTPGLLVAAEVEVFCAAQGLGWDCSKTNGQGLSRVLAQELYPGVFDSFHTTDRWLDSGRPDYLTHNPASGVDSLSNGCSVLFLYYLRYILGYEWARIVQTGGATFEETFVGVTGQSSAYSTFRDFVDSWFPPGIPSGLQVDNPFLCSTTALLQES